LFPCWNMFSSATFELFLVLLRFLKRCHIARNFFELLREKKEFFWSWNLEVKIVYLRLLNNGILVAVLLS
jgi:hypothetical protein